MDWTAVAAIGTWVASITALILAVWRPRDRARDNAEAKVIAMLLEMEMSTIVVRAEELQRKISDEFTMSMIETFLQKDANTRTEIGGLAMGIPTEVLESVAWRLHVLPLSSIRPLLTLLSKISEMRLAGEALAEMDDSFAYSNIPGFFPHFSSRVDALVEAAKCAEAARSAIVSD